MLTDEKIKSYEQRLEEEKKKLLSQIEAEEKIEDFGDDVDSLEENADEVEEESNRLAIAGTFKDRVNEIDAAINKIRKGEYGMCETCKGAIGEDVLNAIPESRQCEQCKQQVQG